MDQIKGTVNRVELIGWLGAAPEQRMLPSGAAVCSFRVATKRFAGRSEAGERQIETDWLPVEAWERLAELCVQSLHKGSRVRVIGHLETQSWEDKKTGDRRFKTFVRAETVLFLDPRADAPTDSEPVSTDGEPMPAEVAVEELPF